MVIGYERERDPEWMARIYLGSSFHVRDPFVHTWEMLEMNRSLAQKRDESCTENFKTCFSLTSLSSSDALSQKASSKQTNLHFFEVSKTITEKKKFNKFSSSSLWVRDVLKKNWKKLFEDWFFFFFVEENLSLTIGKCLSERLQREMKTEQRAQNGKPIFRWFFSSSCRVGRTFEGGERERLGGSHFEFSFVTFPASFVLRGDESRTLANL